MDSHFPAQELCI